MSVSLPAGSGSCCADERADVHPAGSHRPSSACSNSLAVHLESPPLLWDASSAERFIDAIAPISSLAPSVCLSLKLRVTSAQTEHMPIYLRTFSSTTVQLGAPMLCPCS